MQVKSIEGLRQFIRSHKKDYVTLGVPDGALPSLGPTSSGMLCCLPHDKAWLS